MGNLHMLGILCVIGGLGTLGCLQADKKRRRLAWLRQLEWNLRTLEHKILQLHMPLALALKGQKDLGKDEIASCFVQWGKLLDQNREYTALDAWQKVVQGQTQWGYLETEDRNLMQKWALQVGKGSEEEEKRLFQFVLAEVKTQQEQAQEKIQSECRLWSYGGFMMGIVIVFIFL